MYPKKPKVKIKSKANSNNNIEDKFRKDLVSKATKSELVFRKFLNDNMIAHEFQKIIHVSVDCKQKFYIADFYFKRYNIIVELDGGYHYTDGQKIKDDLRSMHLRRAGYFVLRFDNSRTEDCKSIYSEILAFIKEKFGDI
jgi:very-short-patch-repair endonuclease